MTIESSNPKVELLCREVEKRFGKRPGNSTDFLALSEDILKKTKWPISQSTLERLWGYGRQRYAGIALHTLDILSHYSGHNDWNSFVVQSEKEKNRESGEFVSLRIVSRNLVEGTRLKIAWRPDRECIIRYLGNDRFIVEKCINSTLQAGATFTCSQFQIGRELVMNDFHANEEDNEKGKSYVVGMNNGLNICEIL